MAWSLPRLSECWHSHRAHIPITVHIAMWPGISCAQSQSQVSVQNTAVSCMRVAFFFPEPVQVDDQGHTMPSMAGSTLSTAGPGSTRSTSMRLAWRQLDDAGAGCLAHGAIDPYGDVHSGGGEDQGAKVLSAKAPAHHYAGSVHVTQLQLLSGAHACSALTRVWAGRVGADSVVVRVGVLQDAGAAGSGYGSLHEQVCVGFVHMSSRHGIAAHWACMHRSCTQWAWALWALVGHLVPDSKYDSAVPN